ncbi:MAG: hypothetical protein JWP91_814 [Fibrobacteres bacterium]|nr:hypothetical protein [Fibrobacterota bacterium]
MRGSRFPDLPASAALCALCALAIVLAAPARGATVNQAAAFYHQGRYDSALANLEALKSQGPFKRRDSLSLYQYLGMSSARLGREPDAVAYFVTLLGLDSLFQFARNEDPAILRTFTLAREAGTGGALPTLPAPPALAGPAPAGQSAPIASIEATSPIAAGHAPSPAPSTPEPTGSVGKISIADSVSPGRSGTAERPSIGLALGALPLGTGWFARGKVNHGLVLGLLQAGGIAVSLYASDAQSREQNDAFQVRDKDELATLRQWQWVQRVSISTALGAYLFSLIASAGD